MIQSLERNYQESRWIYVVGDRMLPYVSRPLGTLGTWNVHITKLQWLGRGRRRWRSQSPSGASAASRELSGLVSQRHTENREKTKQKRENTCFHEIGQAD